MKVFRGNTPLRKCVFEADVRPKRKLRFYTLQKMVPLDREGKKKKGKLQKK